MQKQAKRAHPDTTYDGIWTTRTIYEASQKLTLNLRHGDRQYNYHTDDGFVEVKLILQMPQFRHHKPHPIDQRCIEFILMLYDSRIEADSYSNPPNTRIRAIQGHTYPGLKIERLYTEITTFDQYNNIDLWRGVPPVYAVVELLSEDDISRWYRTGIHTATRLDRWHTLKLAATTDALPLKERTVLYAFIEIKAIFENKIKTYITNAGRLVIPQNLPYALVVTVRNLRGDEIIALPQSQPPKLPIGPPQARDIREPPRGEQYPMGGNSGGQYPQ